MFVPSVSTPQVHVTVTNALDEPRPAETIAVPWRDVLAHLPGARLGYLIVRDARRVVLPSQVTGGRLPAELLFQHDFVAGEHMARFTIEVAVHPVQPAPTKVHARFVPERLDDFAWENDRIAFRMYGPALARVEGTSSSGIDVWVKSTRRLVLDDWYQAGDYHKDHGEGLDGYKVGPSRGCGGLGVWDHKRLYTSSTFSAWRVLANGPIRAVFELNYDTWDVHGRPVSEVTRISLDAGVQFTRIESTVESPTRDALTLGLGIVQRAGVGGVREELAREGWLAYWEPELPPNGHIACAIAVPGVVLRFESTASERLALVAAEPGLPVVYYAGAGWSKSADFARDEDWFQVVRAFALRLRAPLAVHVAAPPPRKS